MFISITTSKVKYDQTTKVEKFLNKLLPRLKQYPGVHAVYYYSKPEKNEANTLIIWENEDSFKRYAQSDLLKEAKAFEEQMSLPSTREGYPLQLAIVD
jgi:heme-degrading monooxygenase HmoA